MKQGRFADRPYLPDQQRILRPDQGVPVPPCGIKTYPQSRSPSRREAPGTSMISAYSESLIRLILARRFTLTKKIRSVRRRQ
jgi:hypothetical protein